MMRHSFFQRLLRRCATPLLALALCACGGAGSTTPLVPESPVTPGMPGGGGVPPGDGGVPTEDTPVQVRSIDGADNNTLDTEMGQAGAALREDTSRAYADGRSTPAAPSGLSARAISNAVCAQDGDTENARGASDMFWLWGQFLDHDIDLTPEGAPAEAFDILVPAGDPAFDPENTGAVVLGFTRSAYVAGTGVDGPRRHVNEVTSWIDASNVYGSDAPRAAALRTLDGTGRLKTSDGDLLPFNTAGLPNAPSGAIPTLFLAGDVRANEQLGLTAMHTLWVREHNRVAGELRTADATLTGDETYEQARRYVGAEIQAITYLEFLPLLLGDGALSPYAGYDEDVDGSVGVLVSTAAYRFGHSMVSGTLLRLDAAGAEIPEGHLALRDAFFQPSRLVTDGGLDPVLRGFAAQTAQALDPKIVDDLRSFLFGAPGAGGLDLAALNIQRGRDHGLPDYNTCRAEHGLARRSRLEEISSDATYVARLESVFDSADEVDVWVGALSEDAVPGAMVGELLFHVLRDQFRRLRDGDRFWFERIYEGAAREQLRSTRLADVIRRNTGIGGELSARVMVVDEDRRGGPRPPRRDPQPLTSLQVQGLRQSRLIR